MQLTAEVVGREPWAVRINGTVYTARPVSGHRVAECVGALERATTPEEARDVIATLLRWAFPIRWRNLWAGDPVRLILRLPVEGQRAILSDFFARLAGWPPARTASPMSGTVLRN